MEYGEAGRLAGPAKFESGRLAGKLPFARMVCAGATETIVVLPGIGDALQPPDYLERLRWRTRKLLPRYYGRYAGRFNVCWIGRRRAMPEGMTTREMAALTAEAVQREFGPVHLRGESMGGFIAQHFAADFPSLTKSLAIVVSACRLTEHGRTANETWARWALDGQWSRLYAGIMDAVYTGWRRRLCRVALRALGPVIDRRVPTKPSDFVVSLAACVAHDTTDRLREIDAPTLVIGGTHDPIFPVAIQRETAAGIAGAKIHLLPGAAHGAFLEQLRAFDDVMFAFLTERR